MVFLHKYKHKYISINTNMSRSTYSVLVKQGNEKFMKYLNLQKYTLSVWVYVRSKHLLVLKTSSA